LLGAVQPGLGHLYAWRPGLAISAWLVSLACAAAYLAVILHSNVVGLYVATILAIMVNLGIIGHAWYTAKAGSGLHRPRPFQLAGALVAFGVASITVSSVLRTWVRHNIVQTFRVPSTGMAPAVMQGDYIIAVHRNSEALRRDVVFTFHLGGATLIKRIVGLSGDTLEMRSGTLLRNARAVEEPYARIDSGSPNDSNSTDFAWQRTALVSQPDTSQYHPSLDSWGPLVVPPRKVFVLGDNRHDSMDSRYVGFIAHDSVIGRPTLVYLSVDPKSGIRWERIGTWIR
jgi:signal peptidase I